MGGALQKVDPSVSGGPAQTSSVADVSGPLTALRFRLLVLQHHRAVYGLARYLLRDGHEAEDAAQDAFERLWRERRKVERPKEWLLRVVRNACMDRLRRSGRTVSDAEIAVPEERDERDPAWHFDQGQLGATLAAAVESLPEPQRSLVVLFDVQGLSGGECARVLELSNEQVKVYLHRARRKLRTKLEHNI
jgi:RNA polymerase sigma-70 factor (ECF subfamily)